MNQSLDIKLSTEQEVIQRGSLRGRNNQIKWCRKCHKEPANWPMDYCMGCSLEIQFKDIQNDINK